MNKWNAGEPQIYYNGGLAFRVSPSGRTYATDDKELLKKYPPEKTKESPQTILRTHRTAKKGV